MSALIAIAGIAQALASLTQVVLVHPVPLISLYRLRRLNDPTVFSFGRWYGEAALLTPAIAAAVVGAVLIWAELVQPRLSFSASGALRLARDTSPEAVGANLPRMLGDPSARLLFHLDNGGWVDDAGHPAPLITGHGRAATVVARDDQPIAAIEYDGWLLTQLDLVDMAVTSVAAALDGRRLAALQAASAEDIEASAARLLHAANQARVEVEQRIVDGPDRTLQHVSALLGDDPVPMSKVHVALREAVAQVRSIARGLHPITLTEQGLGVALDDLARRAEVRLTAEQVPAFRLPPAVEVTFYLVVAAAVACSSGPVTARFSIDGAATVDVEGWAGPLNPLVADRVHTLGGTATSDGGVLSVSVPLPDC